MIGSRQETTEAIEAPAPRMPVNSIIIASTVLTPAIAMTQTSRSAGGRQSNTSRRLPTTMCAAAAPEQINAVAAIRSVRVGSVSMPKK